MKKQYAIRMIANAIYINGRKRSNPAPDGAPSALILTVVDDTTIKLDWTNGSTNEDGLRIYISTDGVTFTEKGTVTGATATYNAEGLTAGTLYYFYVVAYKGGLESTASNTVNATTIPVPILELDFVQRAMSQFVYNILDGTTRTNYFHNSEILNSNTYGLTFVNMSAGDFVQGAADPDGGNTAWTATSANANAVIQFKPDGIPDGQTCILSFWARAAVNTTVTIYAYWDPDYTAQNITITPTWQQFTFTKAYKTDGAFWIGGGGSFSTGKVIELWHPMINLGTEVLQYMATPNKDWYLGSFYYPDAFDPTWTDNGLLFDGGAKLIHKIDQTNITGATNFTVGILLKLSDETVQGGNIISFNGLSNADIIAMGRIGKVFFLSSAGDENIMGDDQEIILDKNYFLLQFIQDGTTAYLRIRKSPILREMTGLSGGMRATLMPGLNAYPNYPEVAYMAVWDQAIKESQGDSVYNYINSRKLGLLISQSTLIVCDGDSNTDVVVPLATISTVYPGLLSIDYAGKAEVINVGIGGKKAIDLITDEPTTIDPFFVGNYANKVVTIMVGINHSGADSATVYGHIRTLCLARKAIGWKVVICTFTPITVQGDYPVWQETYRQEVNALIRANYTEFADALADVGADETIGVFGSQENLTYYSADEIHLTEAGHEIVRDIVKAAIDSIVTI
jgi:lysophospholipase L1-like esterase